jgi:hypothetical protein
VLDRACAVAEPRRFNCAPNKAATLAAAIVAIALQSLLDNL